jgi:uncharacterized membrane protein YjgN (DUF898 family)
MPQGVGRFEFNEDVGGFAVNAIAAYLITALTLGLGAPIGIVLMAQWFAKNATLDGQSLAFTGKAGDLFGRWIGWYLLTIVTFGIYAFWLYPKLIRWILQNMETA